MDSDYWIGELGRLYQRSSEAIENDYTDAVEPLASEFNEALSELKSDYPNNEIVQRISKVDAYTEDNSGSSGGMMVIAPPTRRDQALHEVRSRCEKISNALNYELPELEKSTRGNQMVMVSVESNQQASQDVSQDVSVESILKLVEIDPHVQNRDELKSVVEEFNEELEKDEPDSGILRDFIFKAKEESATVAAKMAIQAIKAAGLTAVGL